MRDQDKKVTAADVIELMVAKYRRRVSSPGFLATGPVSDALGVSEATVKRWCDSGLLEVVRTVGGHRKISAESVAAFMNGPEYKRRIKLSHSVGARVDDEDTPK